MQLHHFFEKSAHTYPNKIALVCNETIYTYQELENLSNQLAHYLLQQKIGQGSIVALLLERSTACYVSILALLKIGAAYVPIEVDYPEERINYILSDLPMQAVLTSTSQAKRSGILLRSPIILDEVQELISSQPKNKINCISNDENKDDLCYIIYTSGSTGRPKGVEITHKSISHYVSVASDAYHMTCSDRVYQGFSLAFDASMEEVWMAFANGATLVACTDKDLRSGVGLIEFLEQNKISFFSTVPTLLASLEGRVDSLRLLILGGETCTKNHINRWMRPGLTILNTYGPTEATVVATYSECQLNKEITIGKALPGYKVLILDEHLKAVPDGSSGELCIGGMGLARGYVNRPDLTEMKFIQNPMNPTERLYRTGDKALITPTGDIQYEGRIDDQIKLRGFRIELNEIESVMMEYEGIGQAVVSLQMLEQPTLVAYLLLKTAAVFELAPFKEFLRSKLPDYMMPALYEQMECLPLLASGKVNRKNLPMPTQCKQQETNYTAPISTLEKKITSIWEQSFKQGPISAVADFFYDLGGHSLLAAKVISELRKIPEFARISILDLYQNPTIQQLAIKLEKDILKPKAQTAQQDRVKKIVSPWNYYLCGIGQFFGCLVKYGISAWPLLIVVLCYNWVIKAQGMFFLESLALYMSLLLLMPVISIGLSIAVKWLVLGKVKPGEYPLWGWFYFKWWLVQGIQHHLVQTKYLAGTPLITLYYRLLGAKIGANCHIATTSIMMPDMLSMGNDSSIGYEVRALGYIVEDGWLKIGTISIGNGCFIGSRSVLNIYSAMEDNSALDNMSMVASGVIIPKNQFYTGSPARKSPLPENHVTRQKTLPQNGSAALTIHYGLLHYFAIVTVMMLHYLSFIPGLVLLSYFYEQHSLLATIALGAPLAAVLLLLVYFSTVYLFKKIIMNRNKPGTYSLSSLYYLRQWMILMLLDGDEIGVLADSLFYPLFLKLLGANLGAKVEMGEAPQLIPELLTIEKGGFAASGVAFAWPDVYKGYITYGRVKVGENAFVGNICLLPKGTDIGTGGLLGCMTLPPGNEKAAKANTYWLGSPPIHLPTREIIGGFPDNVTYNPSKRLYLLRLITETFRVILPSTCSLILVCALFAAIEYLLANYSILTTIAALPVLEMGFNLIIVSGLIGLKWLLLGKIKPSITPLWDVFIWKNDIREFSFEYYINPHLTIFILGTPFISMLYRAMGAKIGKRAFINTEGLAEFDLIHIGDNVCINADTLIQTHLYEDRIFKLDNLTIQDGCNIGVGSMILYNTVMEPNSSLGSFSLLMKGEHLPANTCWEGSPAQSTAYSPDGWESTDILVVTDAEPMQA